MPSLPFRSVLVANRGAIAARIIRCLREHHVRAIAVYSEADADLPYLRDADEAHCIGPGPARESYLVADRILELACERRAEAVHPGYGFLSENASFARAAAAAGIVFIGPAPDVIDAMGEKTAARALMGQKGLPLARGSAILPADNDAVLAAARDIGFPVLVKPAGGGGGIGMLAVKDEAGLLAAVERARGLAGRSFANPDVYLEKLIETPRHIEFQLIGDQYGQVRHLFERDCSLQRRHQKVIEESRAPNIPISELDAMAEVAVRAVRDIGYHTVGTVEMLRGADGVFSFLEMNTRLQVEHAVTEMITGIDLVAAQIQTAGGAHLRDVLSASIFPQGHAVEARVYAEDPKNFLPSPGLLTHFRPPATTAGLRVETGYAEGVMVTPFYDPMIAKVIAHGPTRAAAMDRLADGLGAFEVAGIKTNIPFVLRALADDRFRAGHVHTGLAPLIAKGG
ncbi:MAG: ATP-grasp domain-containing protein [Acetobacteraceae bacterium]|nr:ATP-grasp domain-containing protein [Acetobacteraceae bacterium]